MAGLGQFTPTLLAGLGQFTPTLLAGILTKLRLNSGSCETMSYVESSLMLIPGGAQEPLVGTALRGCATTNYSPAEQKATWDIEIQY